MFSPWGASQFLFQDRQPVVAFCALLSVPSRLKSLGLLYCFSVVPKQCQSFICCLPTVETSLVPSVSWNLAGSRTVFIDLCGFLNPCLVLPYILWTGSDHAFWEFLPLPSVIFPGFDYSHHFISPSLRLLKYLKFFTRPICTAPRSNSVANADGTSTYPLHCFCW